MTRAALVEHLLSEHGGKLRSIARKHARTLEDAEDALQEVTRIALEQIPTERGDGAIGWFVLSLKRKCWELARAHTAPAAGALPDCAVAEADPLHVLSERESLRGLRELKPDQRTALFLLGAGHSYEDICALTGWTYTKVNRCLVEGRATARERLLVEAA